MVIPASPHFRGGQERIASCTISLSLWFLRAYIYNVFMYQYFAQICTMIPTHDPLWCRLHELDPVLCGARLPAVIGSLVPLLAAEQDGVRFASGQCLKNLLHRCVDPALVATGVSHVAMSGGKPPAAAAIVAAVSTSLDARNEDAWDNALPGTPRTALPALSPRTLYFTSLATSAIFVPHRK